MKGRFMGADVSDIKEHLAFEFDIEDEEAGGAFYVEVKDGALYVEPYEYYDRDARFICAPEVLVKIATGEMDPVWAFPYGSNKYLKLVLIHCYGGRQEPSITVL